MEGRAADDELRALRISREDAMARSSKAHLVGRTFSRPTMTYLKPDQRRALEAAAEAEQMAIGTWLRRLIVTELGRIAREQPQS